MAITFSRVGVSVDEIVEIPVGGHLWRVHGSAIDILDVHFWTITREKNSS